MQITVHGSRTAGRAKNQSSDSQIFSDVVVFGAAKGEREEPQEEESKNEKMKTTHRQALQAKKNRSKEESKKEEKIPRSGRLLMALPPKCPTLSRFELRQKDQKATVLVLLLIRSPNIARATATSCLPLPSPYATYETSLSFTLPPSSQKRTSSASLPSPQLTKRSALKAHSRHPIHLTPAHTRS